MTIKQWFYKHPNITFVLLFLIMSYLVGHTIQHLANSDWLRAAYNGVAAIIVTGCVVRWWDEQQ